MSNNIVYLNSIPKDLAAGNNEEVKQSEFHQYIFSSEHIDKVSFYDIQDFDKKNKSLIQLY